MLTPASRTEGFYPLGLAAAAAMWPAKDVTKLVRLVMSFMQVNWPFLSAVRGEARQVADV